MPRDGVSRGCQGVKTRNGTDEEEERGERKGNENVFRYRHMGYFKLAQPGVEGTEGFGGVTA